MTKLGIMTKKRVALATVSEYEIIWLQYSLEHLMGWEVEMLDLKQISTLDTAAFDWLIIDCTGAHMDRAHIEKLLSEMKWKPGRVIVRFGSSKEFAGGIDGVHVLSWHAKSPEYVAIMRTEAA